MKCKKTFIEFVAFPFEYADGYIFSGGDQVFDALPRHLNIGVRRSDYDIRDFIFYNQIAAGRCFSVMAARFQVYINCSFLQKGFILYRIYGMNFCMWHARFLMPAFADDFVLKYNYAANQRIGIGHSEPVFGELDASAHVFLMYLHFAKI